MPPKTLRPLIERRATLLKLVLGILHRKVPSPKAQSDSLLLLNLLLCFELPAPDNILRHPPGVQPALQIVNGGHLALLDDLEDLAVGLEQPADVAETEGEEVVDDLTVSLGCLLALELVVVQEEGVVLLLE
jgi:hypothetical protein